jgi:hypothetical protein
VARARGERKHAFLRRVVEVTGGRVFTADGEDLRAGFLDVLRDIRNRYLLSYSPRGVPDSGWHTLSVKLKVKLKPGPVEVLARPGYWRAPRVPGIESPPGPPLPQ